MYEECFFIPFQKCRGPLTGNQCHLCRDGTSTCHLTTNFGPYSRRYQERHIAFVIPSCCLQNQSARRADTLHMRFSPGRQLEKALMRLFRWQRKVAFYMWISAAARAITFSYPSAPWWWHLVTCGTAAVHVVTAQAIQPQFCVRWWRGQTTCLAVMRVTLVFVVLWHSSLRVSL